MYQIGLPIFEEDKEEQSGKRNSVRNWIVELMDSHELAIENCKLPTANLVERRREREKKRKIFT